MQGALRELPLYKNMGTEAKMTPKQLKKARESLKMSQQSIADELEISKRYWIYRETGDKPITRLLSRAVRDLVQNPEKRA